MLVFKLTFEEKIEAENANDAVNDMFVGLHDFIDNKLIVTPIEYQYVEGHPTWNFNICIDDSNVDKTYDISLGQVEILGKSVWMLTSVKE